MSNIEISSEDRERLAKTKFGEWFDEFWDKKFNESFEKSLSDARGKQPGQQGQPVQPQATPDTPLPQQRPQRKRSLLEECFSQTFGF